MGEPHDSKLTEAQRNDIFASELEKAISSGKGWKSESEKRAYLDKVGADDFLPAIFCSNEEELARAPDAEAFAGLVYDDETPASLMITFKEKGNESMGLGRKNKAKNVQYYRDAINHYMEALGWADKVVPTDGEGGASVDLHETNAKDRLFTAAELDKYKSVLLGNRAMAHMELKNWGFVVQDSAESLRLDPSNVKSYYRLARARQARREYEECADVCSRGLEVDPGNGAIAKVAKAVEKEAAKARRERQRRERERVERVGKVKSLWKWCKSKGIKLGRVPLVSSVTDEEEDLAEDDPARKEMRWNHHQPHTGKIPSIDSLTDFTWPTMFLYPGHGQSDFVEHFGGSEMLAVRMAEVFPEEGPPAPWDLDGAYRCSSLAVYFEVHPVGGGASHPESVRALGDMGECMRFFENCRRMKGSSGQRDLEEARAEEREMLRGVRDSWRAERGRWAPAPPCDVVRVHPAATLERALAHPLMVVPNFVATFMLFPEDHPAHKEFLRERKVVDVLQPNE